MELDVSGVGDLHVARSQRIADHQASIASERAHVLTRIEQLKAHLAELDRESALLTQLLNAEAPSGADVTVDAHLPLVETPATPVAPASVVEDASVPRPRGRTSSGGKRSRRGGNAAKSQRGTKVGARSAQRDSQPTLVALVQAILGETHEPRLVREVAATLAEKHPDRAATNQVVRNTLENLVAKGLAERERKQGSVFYTGVTSPDDAVQRSDESEAAQAEGEEGGSASA